MILGATMATYPTAAARETIVALILVLHLPVVGVGVAAVPVAHRTAPVTVLAVLAVN